MRPAACSSTYASDRLTGVRAIDSWIQTISSCCFSVTWLHPPSISLFSGQAGDRYNTPLDSPMVRSLQNLIKSAQLARTASSSNSGSSGESAGVRLIATLVQSPLTHYGPTRWADLPGGLQAMEHLKDAHMITLRHLLSCEQSSWVAREVTC
ncbi:unnamed protein product [Mesocestoides corti]|uniref:Uncharacterized protein n=1 Tax=Mesocestoides corti TaxID=53468 RepID=A0A0R3UDA4_MESCO|nr:unnamed protein product [Mesocestoides corti]